MRVEGWGGAGDDRPESAWDSLSESESESSELLSDSGSDTVACCWGGNFLVTGIDTVCGESEFEADSDSEDDDDDEDATRLLRFRVRFLA